MADSHLDRLRQMRAPEPASVEAVVENDSPIGGGEIVRQSDIAKRFGVSHAAVYKWRQQGLDKLEIPGVPGPCWYWSDVKLWREERIYE